MAEGAGRYSHETRQPSAAAIVETADRVVMVLVAAAFACTLMSLWETRDANKLNDQKMTWRVEKLWSRKK